MSKRNDRYNSVDISSVFTGVKNVEIESVFNKIRKSKTKSRDHFIILPVPSFID